MVFRLSYAYFFAFFILFITISCEKQFNTVVEVEIPELDNQLVLNCIFNDTSFFQVMVYGSRSALNENLDIESFIDNATVNLLADGNYLETLSLQQFDNDIDVENTTLQYYQSINKPIANTIYTLEVSAPNYPTARATAQLPTKVLLDEIAVVDTVFWQNDDAPNIETDHAISRYKLNVKFNDIANQNNYYYLKSNVGYHIDVENALATLDIWRQTNPDTLSGIEDYIYIVANEAIGSMYQTCLYTNDASFEETKDYSEFDFEIDGADAQDICYFGLNIFSDRLFENETKELNIQIEYVYNGLEAYFPDAFETQYLIELGNVSEDMFLYQRSAQLQYNNQNNFFAEPIRV